MMAVWRRLLVIYAVSAPILAPVLGGHVNKTIRADFHSDPRNASDTSMDFALRAAANTDRAAWAGLRVFLPIYLTGLVCLIAVGYFGICDNLPRGYDIMGMLSAPLYLAAGFLMWVGYLMRGG